MSSPFFQKALLILIAKAISVRVPFVLNAKLPHSVKKGEKLGEPLPPERYALSVTNGCDHKGQLPPLGPNGDLGQFREGGVEVSPLRGKAITAVLLAP